MSTGPRTLQGKVRALRNLRPLQGLSEAELRDRVLERELEKIAVDVMRASPPPESTEALLQEVLAEARRRGLLNVEAA